MEVRQFTSGMVTDITPRKQPENTYRFALNAALEGREGRLGSILSEEGNAVNASVTDGHTIIGHVLTNTSDIILFTTDDTTSEIGIFNPDTKTYSVLISDSCLSFSTQYPVKALFRIRKGCERVIYFTDRNNPYRTINIDSLSQYYNADGSLNCNSIAFTRETTPPILTIDEVRDNGGQLEVGAYQFAVRYLDEDLNESNWFYVTNPVWIYEQSQTDDFDNIVGGVPLQEDAEGVIGGVPTTSKSIVFTLTELDTNWRYFQIAALHTTATTSTVSSIYIQPEIVIADSTYTYVYGGPDSNADITTDLGDIVVDQLNIGVVQTHAQLDNRLWLAGISGNQYDYTAFQEEANNITVTWTTRSTPLADATTVGNSKNPLTPTTLMTMMGDEVYALAIQFLHSNGEWSPAFHIPGRELIRGVDDVPFTANADTAHLGTASSYPTWQVKSTANTLGRLGYYETDVAYPDTLNCSNQRIFPTGNIRHHRMPSRDIAAVHDDTSAFPIGLTFSVPTYPADDIVGHRFLVSIRNESNSTVVDGAITVPVKYFGTGQAVDQTIKHEYLAYNAWASSQYGEFAAIVLSPKILTESSLQNFDHIRLNKALNFTSYKGVRLYQSGGFDLNNASLTIEALDFKQNPTDLVDVVNRNITGSLFVSPKGFQTPTQGFGANIDNSSYLNTFHFICWDRDYRLLGETNTKHKYITLKRTLTPYGDLESIQYRPLHYNYLRRTDSHTIYGGDAVITELCLPDTHFITDTEHVHGNTLGRAFVESTVNFAFTYGSTPEESKCDAIWRADTAAWDGGYIGDKSGDWFEAMYFEQRRPRDWTLQAQEELCTTGLQYAYNDDYSKLNIEKTYFPLPSTFNYCSGCLNDYPYRLMYSEKSFQEETQDNYRVFLANNYNDFLGKEGTITNLFIDKDQLYALTERALWFIPTRPQTLNSNEATVYVGTGEVLSIPPKRMATSDHSYGGTTEQLSVISTEFGTTYVDTVGRKIFLLSDKLGELSQEGINNFFEDHIDIKFLKQYKRLIGTDYPYTNPTHNRGVGYTTTYDPRYKRLIFHKKDYELLETKWRDVPTTGYISFDNTLGKFVNGTRIIEVGDPEWFADRSWTLSYSFKHRAWASYHSYMPSYMFHDEDNFFTVRQDNDIWEHNQVGKSCNFYGIQAPHILDFVSAPAPVTTKVFKNIFLHADVQEYFSPSDDFRIVNNEIFQKVVLYNTDQISGVRDIVLKGSSPFVSVTSAPEDVIIEKSEGVWKLSNLRDYNSSHYGAPLFTSRWESIQDQFYIDKIPTPEITQTTDKTLFDTQRFRDEWLGVRLYYTPTDSTYRMATDLAGIQLKPSFR